MSKIRLAPPMTFADLSTTILEFVRHHPNWAAFVVFALAFGESLPFISELEIAERGIMSIV